MIVFNVACNELYNYVSLAKSSSSDDFE